MADDRNGTHDPDGGVLAGIIETVIAAPIWLWHKITGKSEKK